MGEPIEPLLERGIEAARSHDGEMAREMLLRVIDLDRCNERAWLWLSSVVELPTDREVCLENVLSINPGNSYAASGLAHLRSQSRDGEPDPPSMLPRLYVVPASIGREGEEPAASDAPPEEQACPACSAANPAWAQFCAQCRAALQEGAADRAAPPSSRRRGRSPITLLETLGAALVFNGRWAFRPEVELASWGRSLSALGMAALFASGWRAAASFVFWLLAGSEAWSGHVLLDALLSALYTLPPALLLALCCVPIALLTGAAARLVGGRQGLRTTLHLAAIAFAAWIVWGALVAPLSVLAPHALGGRHVDQVREVATLLAAVMAGGAGAILVVQATGLAQDLVGRRAAAAVLMAAGLAAGLLYGLDAATGGRSTGLVATLLTAALMPQPDLSGGWFVLVGN